MAELTKEYFEEQIKGIKTHAEKLQESLAVMSAQSFENIERHLVSLDRDLGAASDDLFTVKNDVSQMKNQLTEINKTTHQIDKRDVEDSNALAKNVVQLQKDVKLLKLKLV
jgi:septal ring factor EnvC (AmiA/AmiB activator)